uniref:Protein ANTAGONIST OF LIKE HETEROCHROMATIN PROTEIN 1-like n=2 Tax=Salarias fasciatus TaxID=181472 RepID=A0A672HMP7_SALFA
MSFMIRRHFYRRRQERRRNAILRAITTPTREKRKLWTHARCHAWWQHACDTWTERDWLLNFRMRRTTFRHLCELLRPKLTRQDTRYRRAVPVELRVAVCLWRLATNLELRSISHLFGVGLSSACVFTQQVVAAINDNLKSQYLHTPKDAEFVEIVKGFHDRWGFPQCAGAVDGTHIPILAPSHNPADYYNRKGFYSIILQGVVDHNMKFWDVNIGWPGRVHDARVLSNSSLYERGQNGTLLPSLQETIQDVDVPLVILGDAAYPLLPWLMKPYQEGRGITAEQTAFNHRLSQARMTVERAFGRLKGRWRCLLKRCDCDVFFVSDIVLACCILHNFCESHNEEYICSDNDVHDQRPDPADRQIGGDSGANI